MGSYRGGEHQELRSSAPWADQGISGAGSVPILGQGSDSRSCSSCRSMFLLFASLVLALPAVDVSAHAGDPIEDSEDAYVMVGSSSLASVRGLVIANDPSFQLGAGYAKRGWAASLAVVVPLRDRGSVAHEALLSYSHKAPGADIHVGLVACETRSPLLGCGRAVRLGASTNTSERAQAHLEVDLRGEGKTILAAGGSYSIVQGPVHTVQLTLEHTRSIASGMSGNTSIVSFVAKKSGRAGGPMLALGYFNRSTEQLVGPRHVGGLFLALTFVAMLR
jgi:hypothetical protein